jgi:hypothetical protein
VPPGRSHSTKHRGSGARAQTSPGGAIPGLGRLLGSKTRSGFKTRVVGALDSAPLVALVSQWCSLPRRSGRSWCPCCLNGGRIRVGAGRDAVTARASKAFSGCSAPALAGGICPGAIRVPVPAGAGWPNGKPGTIGAGSGAPSWASWISGDSSSGKSAFSTAPLPRQKRGCGGRSHS